MIAELSYALPNNGNKFSGKIDDSCKTLSDSVIKDDVISENKNNESEV